MDDEQEEIEVQDTSNSHLELAYALVKEENFEVALPEIDAAIARAWTLVADAYNLRGIILEELGHNDDAEEAYRQALEIDPGFQEAADNLRDLEAELGIDEEPVTIASFGSVAEAHLARGQLEAEGIWSFVADEYAAMTVGPAVSGGSRLMVRAVDLPRAIEILGIETEDEDWDEDEDDEDWDEDEEDEEDEEEL